MRIKRAAVILFGALSFCMAAATSGCQVEPPRTPFMTKLDVSDDQPIRWQLVEKRYGDLQNHGAAGDGVVDPDATTLVFEPLYAEQLTTDIYVSAFPDGVVLVKLSHKNAGVGQRVTATVRVRDPAPGGIYRLMAKGSNSYITVFGDNPIFLTGEETGEFTFTSKRSGCGDVAIAIDRVD